MYVCIQRLVSLPNPNSLYSAYINMYDLVLFTDSVAINFFVLSWAWRRWDG